MNGGHIFVLAKQSLGFSQGLIISASIMRPTVVVDEFANPFIANAMFNSLGI